MEQMNYEAIVEAILFTMGESVPLEKIAAALELNQKETKTIVENLMKKYQEEMDKANNPGVNTTPNGDTNVEESTDKEEEVSA